MTPRLEQYRERHEADDLGAGSAEAAVPRPLVARIEGEMERRDIEVGEVDRYLCGAELRDHPSDRFHRLENARLPDRIALRVDDRVSLLIALHPPALADVERHARREPLVHRVQVHVVCDEELARADDGGAALRDELGRTEVGLPVVMRDLLFQPFVLSLANVGEVAAVRRARGELVEIDGELQLGANALAEAAGEDGAFIHRHVGDGNEGDDVGGADTRVRAAVRRHVDQFDAFLDEAEGRLEHRLRLADERDDSAVRIRARIDVEERDNADGRRRLRDGLINLRPPALGDVRYALDELHAAAMLSPHASSVTRSRTDNQLPIQPASMPPAMRAAIFCHVRKPETRKLQTSDCGAATARRVSAKTAKRSPTATAPPIVPCRMPSRRNGPRMIRSVAPTRRMISISSRYISFVSRMTFAIVNAAAIARMPPAMRPDNVTTSISRSI